jgi:predicted dehydrogenase
MTAPIGVGIVGTGKHGARYAAHVLRDVPGLRLAAISRRDAARGRAQADEWGARFHADWRALVADPEVEAVVSVVPPTQNRAIAEATARAGKALLVEKPLAATVADAWAIVAAVRVAGIPCLMAHTLRWNAVVRAVREALPLLGGLYALAVNQRFEPSPLEWLDRPELSGGGITLHTGVHSFDLVRFLTGREVVAVGCRMARVHTRRTEDNFAAVLELDRPETLVTVSGCRATAGRSGLIDAAGAEGQLVGDHQLHFAYRVRGLERTAIALPPPAATVREALAAFVRLVRDGEEPGVRPEDGARAVAIAEACARAAATGTTVAVASPDPT